MTHTETVLSGQVSDLEIKGRAVKFKSDSKRIYKYFKIKCVLFLHQTVDYMGYKHWKIPGENKTSEVAMTTTD